MKATKNAGEEIKIKCYAIHESWNFENLILSGHDFNPMLRNNKFVVKKYVFSPILFSYSIPPP